MIMKCSFGCLVVLFSYEKAGFCCKQRIESFDIDDWALDLLKTNSTMILCNIDSFD